MSTEPVPVRDLLAEWLDCMEALYAASVGRELDLATMPYAEYLVTPEWQEKRLAALARADYRCQLCGAADRALHVHHNTYERRGHEWDSDLIALCAPCHRHHHGIADPDPEEDQP